MKDFSNRYIFIFSIVMVSITAIVLSSAAILLQPKQEKNREVEKKQNILASVGIESPKSETETLYAKHIINSFVINKAGEVQAGVDAFTVNLRAEQKKAVELQSLPVFEAVLGSGDTVLIIPLEGKGLWGPIYGYLSLKSDHSTIYGTTFDHKGETPGLGAEINTSWFEDQFIGKQLFEGDKFKSVTVVKGGAQDDDPYGVDAISGGTITSKGLEAMLFDCLEKYSDYLIKSKK